MTLTDASKFTKQVGVGLVIFCIIFLVLRLSFSGIQLLLKKREPPPESEKPAVAFGKLPFLSLNSLPTKTGSSPVIFVLDTPTGQLPEFPDKVWVYKFEKPKPNLASINKAKTIAKSLMFNTDPIVISANEHLWQDKENGRKLKINIINLDITLETELEKIVTQELPNLSEAKQIAKNFLKNKNVPEEFFQTEPVTNLLQIKNNEYRQAVGLSESNIIQVDFFRNLVVKEKTEEEAEKEQPAESETDVQTTNYPILGPRLKQGLAQIFVANKKSDGEIKDIPQASVFAYHINFDERSDYPSKPVDKAYDELQQGKGYLVHLLPKNQDPNLAYTPQIIKKVVIRKIYLAYFDNPKFQPYLQPIYVFEGEATLENGEKAEYGAYIPAVASEYAE